jgi:flagellar protein FliS
VSMLVARGADLYRQTEVQSRSPLELVVMLYDGAIRFMAEARAAIERRDIPARRDAVSRALAIVAELQNTLDLSAGGTVAASLDDLYRFVTSRLMDASFRQDPQPIDEAIGVFTTLREGWSAIAKGDGASAP